MSTSDIVGDAHEPPNAAELDTAGRREIRRQPNRRACGVNEPEREPLVAR